MKEVLSQILIFGLTAFPIVLFIIIFIFESFNE